MPSRGIAKLFMHRGSQAVRLPKEFRTEGKEVSVRRFGRGILLEPIRPGIKDIRETFAEIDRLTGGVFLPNWRSNS
jgi:antitoxin VapB